MKRKVKNTDLKEVVDAASALNITEFEVFQQAYQSWFGRVAGEQEIDAWFARYMSTADVPVWVRAFTRQVRQLQEESRLHSEDFGLQPLPDTTYWKAFLGGMAFAFMVMVLAGLIYLVIQAEETALAGCQLPPCY